MRARGNVGVNEHDFASQNHATVNSKEWLRQIKLHRASFEYNHRIKHSLDAQPCFIDGMASLIVAPDLEIRDPFAFTYITRFAEENALLIVLDRRTQQESVELERRAA